MGRVGISENTSEPVVIDWRAPLASVYYENNTGQCTYTVRNEGSFTIDLKRKRTYEIENDQLKDFFDSDVVANDELLTKYLAKNKTAVLGKINMLNEILMAKLENELAGRYVSYPPDVQKELRRMYRWHFGRKEWKESVFEVYGRFLEEQAENGRTVPYTEGEFDLYDLSALAYLYKRIKETDGIREASHVIIDEARDFGMMAYHTLAYCLRGCTYTIMGDVSQNIHFGYGLNDWEELRQLLLPPGSTGFCLLKKSYRNTVEISHFAPEILWKTGMSSFSMWRLPVRSMS